MILYPTHHIHPYPTGEDVVDPSVAPCRVWIPEQPMLVLGYSQDVEREIHLASAETAGISIYKRKGGGGAVLLTQGVVCVALRFQRKPGFGIAEYFSAANGMIQTVFKNEWKVDLVPRGISDLAIGDHKALGSSLYLPRDHALYLASILVNAPLSLFDQYLRYPSREPEYRRGRNHGDFLRNLSDVPGMESVSTDQVRGKLEIGLGRSI